ncbi:MAG: DUF512 domain-containing protein, partial [Calditrichaeota bacterium]
EIKKELGSSFIYLSDEFYIRTGKALPGKDYYEGFYQLENGIGLTRDMVDRFRSELPRIRQIIPPLKFTFVSGKLGALVLKRYIIPSLTEIPHASIKLYQVPNYFFGTSIVVAGLLVGSDIYNHLKNKELGDYIVLPPRVLNHDGLFLDDWTVEKLEKMLNRKIIIFPDSFLTLFENIRTESWIADEDEARKIRHSGPSLYLAEHMKIGEELCQQSLNGKK